MLVSMSVYMRRYGDRRQRRRRFQLSSVPLVQNLVHACLPNHAYVVMVESSAGHLIAFGLRVSSRGMLHKMLLDNWCMLFWKGNMFGNQVLRSSASVQVLCSAHASLVYYHPLVGTFRSSKNKRSLESNELSALSAGVFSRLKSLRSL